MNAPAPILADRRTRHAAGRAMRATHPREAHAAWTPQPGRNPAAILAAQEESRIPELVPERAARMGVNAFAFYRGAAAVMAADLASQPHTGLFVQLCGDAHLANFGSFASPEGRAVFDVNDFDETLPGPFEWDVKRLAASLVLAAEQQGLSKETGRSLVLRAVRQYRRLMGRLAEMAPFDAWHSAIDLVDAVESIEDARIRRLAKRHLRTNRRSHLGQYDLVRASDAGPRLADHGHVEHIARFEQATHDVFEAYRASAPPQMAALLRHYRLCDAAFKVVGVGSVGTFCAIGLFVAGDGESLLLQAKEAQASVLECGLPASAYKHAGERVVAGQRLMQAEPDLFLGTAPRKVAGRYFYLRRLKDSRLARVGDMIEAELLPFASGLCGRTLARAHARSGDAAMIAGYLGEGEAFDEAIADFACAYAATARQDWEAASGARG